MVWTETNDLSSSWFFTLLWLAAKKFWDISWCYGSYCWLAIVLWCGYCSMSFESFILRHLVIATSATPRNCQIVDYKKLVYTKTEDSVVGALWLVTEARDIKCYSPPSICARKLLSLIGINESKIIIFVLHHLTVLVYAETTIHLSVCGQW